MTSKRYLSLILVLGSLVALGPFTIDMYLPGFQAIAADLHTTENRVSLSLSSYFVGISAGQLIYGPLLDRFGRKKPLYIGICIYMLASLACALTQSIDAFIVWRFVQALGSCAAGVAAMAMVRDLFPLSQTAKVFSLLMLVLGLSPLIAPTLGSYVTVAFGWQAVFLILLALGLLNLLASWLWLPDVYRPDPGISLKPGPMLRNFRAVLREPQFYVYALAGSMAFAGLFVYVASSPILFMSVFKVGEKAYGWIFALLSVGFIGGSQLNNFLLRHFRSAQLILVPLCGQAAVALILLVGSLNGWFGLGATIALLFVFLACLGIANPNAVALTLAPFSRNAGSASALMGMIQMSTGAFASACLGFFRQDSSLPLAILMSLSSALALVVLLFRKPSKTALHAADGTFPPPMH